MLGAILGDIIGSIHERGGAKILDFDFYNPLCRVTDDTVMTIATAAALLGDKNYTAHYQYWGKKYLNVGYGKAFKDWIIEPNPQPYNSWGNGSAMRVSPIGWVFDTLAATEAEAKVSAECTHNHLEGIKGAQSVAAAIFMARTGATKSEIKQYISMVYHYDLERTIDAIRPNYRFDVSCQGSVPESIIAFLQGENMEQTIRLAISLGGDTDTMACIAASIAEAFYKEIPSEMIDFVYQKLNPNLKIVLDCFEKIKLF